MSRATRWSLALLAVVALAASAFLGGFAISHAGENASPAVAAPAAAEATAEERQTSSNAAEEFGVLGEIYQILADEFVDPDAVDPQLLKEAAINGALQSLGDPNTVYIDPQSLVLGAGDASGVYEGIGASVAQDPETNEIVIVTPFTGSPAQESGIRAGDVILEVNGQSTEGWSLERAVATIRGPRGTQVTIRVRHEDGSEEELIVTRDEIRIRTVFSCPGATLGEGDTTDRGLGVDCPLLDANGQPVSDVAYIRVEQFGTTTTAHLEEALQEIVQGNYRGIIVDLRNNPGGLLDSTVEAADLFLGSGVILIEVNRDGNENEFRARPGDEAEGLPVVVLVNGLSASGSEVFAAALAENGRATIVGETTFGKGTVNRLRLLSDGGGLYVSIARWLTPQGTLIDQVGIDPDIEVIPTDEDIDAERDVQLFRAIEEVLQQSGS